MVVQNSEGQQKKTVIAEIHGMTWGLWMQKATGVREWAVPGMWVHELSERRRMGRKNKDSEIMRRSDSVVGGTTVSVRVTVPRLNPAFLDEHNHGCQRVATCGYPTQVKVTGG